MNLTNDALNTAETTQTEVTAKPARRVSNHINHALCVELRGLLEQVDVNTAQVTRGSKNPKTTNLITDKERELIEAFVATDYNIKKTGEQLGFSHTNVWQRLYGNNKADKPAKGILGKLREYVAAPQVAPATESEAV